MKLLSEDMANETNELTQSMLDHTMPAFTSQALILRWNRSSRISNGK